MSAKTQAFSAVRWTTFATIGRVVLQTIQLIVMARLISPHDFGLMAMIISVTAFIQLFADLGLSTTIIYAREISAEVLSTLYWLNLLSGAVLSIAVWMGSPTIAGFYGTPELEMPLALAGTSFILLAIGQQIKVLAEKRLAFRSIAVVELVSATFSTMLTITVAYFGGGVYSLVAGVIALSGGNSLLYWLFARDRWVPSLHFNIADASENLKSGLYLLLTSLANTATVQADVMIVGRLLGSAALGLYTVPRELTLKVMFATNPIVTRVGTPLLAKAQGDKDLLRKIYLSTLRMTSAINFPIYACMAVFRREVVITVFGSAWLPSANLLGIMAVWGMFRALGNPIGSLLYGTGNARLALIQSVCVTLLIIPTIGLGSAWGTLGVASALTVFYIVFAFVVWWAVVRPITDASLIEYTLQWATPLMITLLSSVLAFELVTPIDGDLPRLAAGLSIGALGYLSLSWFFNRSWCLAMLGMAGMSPRTVTNQ
ncbi:MOP flippase family protein (plasmid) [Rhizobium sp. CB3171]|uniref:MOP flippase family protein n=1 Tax=Rhizobium sp. CB3171 TaxID=3039157 RepID=UPI0024B16E03|nr:MOP flippase family protein [Rhizobium sp. CB3171]WFU07158.1 MOP flippase family protein [Rhizobium sp. CB3171]